MAEPQGPEDEQREIAPGVLLSVSHELTLELLQAPPNKQVRLVVGYAGWGPGQLDTELAASAWLTTDVDPGPHLRRAGGTNVGNGDSPPGNGPGRAADQRVVFIDRARPSGRPCSLPMRHTIVTLALVAAALASGCRGSQPEQAVSQSNAPTARADRCASGTGSRGMTARFAPVDLTADISSLPGSERQALKRLVEAAEDPRRPVPAPGVGRQRDDAARPGSATRRPWAGPGCTISSSTRGRGRGSTTTSRSSPARRRSRRRPTSTRPAPPRKTSRPGSRRCPRRSAARATGFFTTIRRGAGRPVPGGAVQPRVPGRARAGGRAAARGGSADDAADAENLSSRSARRLSSPTTTTRATSPGWSSTPPSSRPSARTRSTKTSGSTTRRRSRRSSPSVTTSRRRSWPASAASCRRSRTTCRSTRSTATPSSARWRRSASSTRCSRPATPTAACRRRPSTCRTTSASSPKRDRSG